VDLRDRRELNNGFGNALSRAIELTVSPVIFGFLGFLLDRWLGTRPVFMIFLFAFTFVYMCWKQFSAYGIAMEKAQREAISGRRRRDEDTTR
jgi:F0F1-type ATP synthase assembly protein I